MGEIKLQGYQPHIKGVRILSAGTYALATESSDCSASRETIRQALEFICNNCPIVPLCIPVMRDHAWLNNSTVIIGTEVQGVNCRLRNKVIPAEEFEGFSK